MSEATEAAADSFYIASFSVGGDMEGLGLWKASDLSPEWTRVCDDLLQARGDSFEHRWNAALSHLTTKFSSAEGAALCTFFVHDQVASSIMLLRGNGGEAENEVSRLFVESLRRTWAHAASPNAFGEALTLSERPLMAVVPFPLNSVSEQNHELVRELSLHLASSYLLNRK